MSEQPSIIHRMESATQDIYHHVSDQRVAKNIAELLYDSRAALVDEQQDHAGTIVERDQLKDALQAAEAKLQEATDMFAAIDQATAQAPDKNLGMLIESWKVINYMGQALKHIAGLTPAQYKRRNNGDLVGWNFSVAAMQAIAGVAANRAFRPAAGETVEAPANTTTEAPPEG